MRRGIRAVKAGKDPQGVFRDEGVVVPTYCNNTVIRMPPRPSEIADKQMMREVGMRLAKDYLQHPPLSNGHRPVRIEPDVKRPRRQSRREVQPAAPAE
jgi:hypothetical protein